MSRAGSEDSGVLGALPIQRGAFAGVGAFLVGYALTYLIKSGDIEGKTPDDGVMTYDSNGEEADVVFSEVEVDPPEVADAVSWLYYEMHNVELDGTIAYTISQDGDSNTQEFDLLLGVDVETYMMVLPPVLLAAAGYWVASSVAVRDETEAAKAGATVTAGYLVTATLGALVFAYNDLNTQTREGYGGEVEQTLEVAYSADLQSAVIFAGLVYPLAFGALGGYIAYRRAETPGPAAGRQTPPHNPQQPQQGPAAGNHNKDADGGNRAAGRQANQRSTRQRPAHRQQSNQAQGGQSGRSGDDSGRP